VALVGHDLPKESRAFLERHLDTSGLHTLDIQQARAWQLFEEDGSRREVYRTAEVAPFIQGAQPEHLLGHYGISQAYYLLQGFEGIRAWRAEVKGLILWEPLQQIMIEGARNTFREVLQSCRIDIVSPNLLEAQAVYGKLPPEELIAAMFNDGARIAALRMGAGGSIIANKATGEQHFIAPAAISEINDQTGAGNTYCGGLLLGFLREKSLKQAAIMGAVSASFCLEQIGVLNPDTISRSERDQRFQILCAR
jgi:hypothetical protein